MSFLSLLYIVPFAIFSQMDFYSRPSSSFLWNKKLQTGQQWNEMEAMREKKNNIENEVVQLPHTCHPMNEKYLWTDDLAVFDSRRKSINFEHFPPSLCSRICVWFWWANLEQKFQICLLSATWLMFRFKNLDTYRMLRVTHAADFQKKEKNLF